MRFPIPSRDLGRVFCILMRMDTEDIRREYREIAESLTQEHAQDIEEIRLDALKLAATIRAREENGARASVLDRLFKRTV